MKSRIACVALAAIAAVAMPTFAAALDVPAVNLSKKWIAENGEKAWGV